jgi:hypothetical protein
MGHIFRHYFARVSNQGLDKSKTEWAKGPGNQGILKKPFSEENFAVIE